MIQMDRIEFNPKVCDGKPVIKGTRIPVSVTLFERKSRMRQIRGVQGRNRSRLLRALGNEGDGVSSAFP